MTFVLPHALPDNVVNVQRSYCGSQSQSRARTNVASFAGVVEVLLNRLDEAGWKTPTQVRARQFSALPGGRSRPLRYCSQLLMLRRLLVGPRTSRSGRRHPEQFIAL